MDYINVISLGAGKQSTYMLLTALEGKYGVKPDYAIFSDTGCEPRYVYDQLQWLKEYCWGNYQFEIITVSQGHLLSDVEEYVDGKTKRASQLPFFLEDGGIVMRQCTADYKIQPLRRKLQEIRGKRPINLWIGISMDEIERMKISPLKYIKHYYPLIEYRIAIDSIIQWFRNTGIPEPGKSACLICPFHSLGYWSMFKKQYPKEFEDACDFDDKIRNYPKLKSRCYLSNQRKPLRDIDFTLPPSLFPELIEECNGLCGL